MPQNQAADLSNIHCSRTRYLILRHPHPLSNKIYQHKPSNRPKHQQMHRIKPIEKVLWLPSPLSIVKSNQQKGKSRRPLQRIKGHQDKHTNDRPQPRMFPQKIQKYNHQNPYGPIIRLQKLCRKSRQQSSHRKPPYLPPPAF